MAYVSAAPLAALLSDLVRPYDLTCKFIVVESDPSADFDRYNLTISGEGNSQPLSHTQEISLPKFTTEGHFTLRGLDYALTYVAFQDYQSLKVDYFVKQKSEYLCQLITNTLVRTLTDAYYRGTVVGHDALQASIETALATCKYAQLIDIDNSNQVMHVTDAVYLVNSAGPFDVDAQAFPESMVGKLDAATTSASGTINQVFRLVKGAEVKDARIRQRKGRVSRCIEDSAIGIGYTPKRLNLLEAQFVQSLKLTNPDAPTVSGPANKLHGKELTTAIMDCGASTYEDAFMVSETGAKALTCIRNYRARFITDSYVDLHVSVGDLVDSSTTLAEYSDDLTGDTFISKIRTIQNQAKVVSIDTVDTDYYGLVCTRYDIVVEEHQALRTGDKITTRGGLKGVAVVHPDDEMPKLEDGTAVDIVVSPKSVYNRQSMVTFWEMMMNLRGQSFTSVPELDIPF